MKFLKRKEFDYVFEEEFGDWIPRDVLLSILQQLDFKTLLRVQQVSKKWFDY